MRSLCIEEYNKEYGLDATLKQKMKGRNRDINVADMTNYQETKEMIEKNQKTIESINNKAIELDNESNHIKEKINSIKKAPVIKDSYIITGEDKRLIESYVDKVDKTNKEYKSIKGLSASLKNLNKTIKEDKNTIKVLKQNNESLELRVENLTDKVETQKEEIDNLRKYNLNLKYQLQELQHIFQKLINFIKKMLKIPNKEKIYSKVTDDLYLNNVIDSKTYDDIQNSRYKESKSKGNKDLEL